MKAIAGAKDRYASYDKYRPLRNDGTPHSLISQSQTFTMVSPPSMLEADNIPEYRENIETTLRKPSHVTFGQNGTLESYARHESGSQQAVSNY